MIVKELRELRRDKRTLALLLGMPLLLLVVFGYAATFDIDELRTRVYGPQAEFVASQLPAPVEVVGVHPEEGEAEARAALRDARATVAIVTGVDPPLALVDGADLFGAKAATAALQQARLSGELPVTPRVEVLFNPRLETSAVMVPALIGVILLMVGTIVTSLGVVRERQAGTLEQLAVMPFRPGDIILGKVLPYFGIALIDMVVITIAGVLLFDVPFNGSFLLLALATVLFLFLVLGFGILISTVSENQSQAVQLAMIVVVPQFLLSGMVFPITSMPIGVRWIGYVLPLTYFVSLTRGIFLRGTPAVGLVQPLAVLAALGLVVFALALVRFRRDLVPAGRDDEPVEAGATGAPA